MASRPWRNSKRKHKNNKNPHITKHIWHTHKTTGHIEIYRRTKIPHGLVNHSFTFACGGVFTGLTRNLKRVPNDPWRRNLSFEFSRTWTPHREGVSCWLSDVRHRTDNRPSRLGDQAVRTKTWCMRTCDVGMSVRLSCRRNPNLPLLSSRYIVYIE
jgi:hypothetical protein